MRGANPSVPVWLVVAMAVLLSLMTHRSVAAEFDSAAPSAAPVMGELRIEGEALERITLARMLGEGTLYDAQHPLVLERPGPSISVPAGKYCLRRIDLNGGYHSDPGPIVEGRNGRPVREAEWLVIIRPDQPCVVKIGVPLKPKVFAYRSGRALYLSYHLLDAGGRSYVPDNLDRTRTPWFTVACNGRVVGSGSFEYG